MEGKGGGGGDGQWGRSDWHGETGWGLAMARSGEESGEVEAERERPGELDWEGGNGERMLRAWQGPGAERVVGSGRHGGWTGRRGVGSGRYQLGGGDSNGRGDGNEEGETRGGQQRGGDCKGATWRGRPGGGGMEGEMGRGQWGGGKRKEVGMGRVRLWEGQRRGEKGQEEGGIHRWI